MCYFSNSLMNLNKTVLRNMGRNEHVRINESSKNELVYDFLYYIYDAFDFNPDYKLNNNNIDYMVSFKQNPVVATKIMELNKDVDLDKAVETYKGLKHLVYAIYTNGVKFIVYKRNQDEFTHFHTFDLKNINKIDCEKYYNMRWHNIFFDLEEMTEKLR